jgi:raffinose/stachyose/melibiose transport system substrate-binding protein
MTARRIGVLALAVVALVASAAGTARSSRSDQITITMIASSIDQPGWQVLIANFERVFPDITVNITYLPSASTVEPTELATGNAPDLLSVQPGCGALTSVCVLAKDGYLAPMLKVPWAKRSWSLATSLMKYGQGLFAFEPGVSFMGMFTNDALFAKLGLKVPQTFSQLLDVCSKAKADGTAAVLFAGGAPLFDQYLNVDLATATLYGVQKGWLADLKAGKVSFEGAAGWHQALQEFVDMSNAGCFEPGPSAATQSGEVAQFAAGQGLMFPGLSTNLGLITAADAQFDYSFHPFPGGSDANATHVFVNLSSALAVNAHSSPQAQAAAQTFVNFVARPKQDALYTQIRGGLTQVQFLKGELPAFMPTIGPVLAHGEYVVNPAQEWWNPSVSVAIQTDAVGLLTGQTTIDDVLNAMDAAWKQGPS